METDVGLNERVARNPPRGILPAVTTVDESEKRMEEEIICNRWKDLADEPASGRGRRHQPLVFPCLRQQRLHDFLYHFLSSPTRQVSLDVTEVSWVLVDQRLRRQETCDI